MQIQRLKELLDYNPETGELLWKPRALSHFSDEGHWKTWNTRFGSTVAGGIYANGYRAVSFSGMRYYAHRIAWAMHTGEWPSDQIDHINQKRDDNRISNLRQVTNHENTKNKVRLKRNTSGVTGVDWDKRKGKWRAQIKHNKRGIFLGYFADFDEATAVRKAAEVKFGYSENHGRAA